MIDQKTIFGNNVKYSVTLPLIKDGKDEWYCQRVLNEAFLEMNHHGCGPVHINVPIEEGMHAIGKYFDVKELPPVKIINRIDMIDTDDVWRKKLNSLSDKKIMFLCGQSYGLSEKVEKMMTSVFKKYNCVFATDKLSNVHTEGTLEISRASTYTALDKTEKMTPDVVISIEGNTALNYKFRLKTSAKPFEHWIVNLEGRVADPFKKLTTVFECSTEQFLDKLLTCSDVSDKNDYFDLWKTTNDKFVVPNFEFSNLYTVNKLLNNMPENSLFNISNSTTIRIAQFFDLSPSIKTYCNRGVNGIDGCMSSFIGQSSVTDKLSFLVVGDLTFFYDMNGIWNRYVGKNVRIMLNNNEGAALFHFNQGLNAYPTLNENVAAEHFTQARAWVESRGFKYLSAKTQEEFDRNFDEFISADSDQPIFFEVFTKKEKDAQLQHEMFNMNREPIKGADLLKENMKKAKKLVFKK